MDTVTQAALGVCIAQAGFSDRLGRKALVVGGFCGVLPDLDFFLTVGSGEFAFFTIHRGWSHSLVVLPFLAFPIAWLAAKWSTRHQKFSIDEHVAPSSHRYVVWYHLCFWALITHPLLDLFMSYGTQLLAPISNARFAIDGISMIDPIYSAPIITVVIMGLHKSRRPVKHWLWATSALIFTTSYLCLGLNNSWDAKNTATAQLTASSFEPIEVRVSPTILNIVLWRVVAKDANGRYAIGSFSSIGRKPIKFQFFESVHNHLVEKALRSEEGRIFRWFSTDMLRSQVEDLVNNGARVILTDMRFGFVSHPLGSPFVAVFDFDQEHNFTRVYTTNGDFDELDFDRELDLIWAMIWGRTLADDTT